MSSLKKGKVKSAIYLHRSLTKIQMHTETSFTQRKHLTKLFHLYKKQFKQKDVQCLSTIIKTEPLGLEICVHKDEMQQNLVFTYQCFNTNSSVTFNRKL